MALTVKRTKDTRAIGTIADRLPEYFDANGRRALSNDAERAYTLGLFLDERLIGFAVFKDVNVDVSELPGLASIQRIKDADMDARSCKQPCMNWLKRVRIASQRHWPTPIRTNLTGAPERSTALSASFPSKPSTHTPAGAITPAKSGLDASKTH